MSAAPLIVVTVRHVREELLCTRGMREWLTVHNFSIVEFVRQGLPVEKLEATGDAFALKVCARARAEAEGGAQ